MWSVESQVHILCGQLITTSSIAKAVITVVTPLQTTNKSDVSSDTVMRKVHMTSARLLKCLCTMLTVSCHVS